MGVKLGLLHQGLRNGMGMFKSRLLRIIVPRRGEMTEVGENCMMNLHNLYTYSVIRTIRPKVIIYVGYVVHMGKM
jgi:hypothetical protein